jgi:hypothetical protein
LCVRHSLKNRTIYVLISQVLPTDCLSCSRKCLYVAQLDSLSGAAVDNMNTQAAVKAKSGKRKPCVVRLIVRL